jgi:signal transduction histidine kinase
VQPAEQPSASSDHDDDSQASEINELGAPPCRRPRRNERWLPAALLAVLTCLPFTGWALCLGDLQGTDGALGVEIAHDPRGAIRHLNELIAQTAPIGAGDLTPAHLYAMLSDAYSFSGDSPAAVDAIRKGLAALRSSDPEPLRRRLRLRFAFMQEEVGQLNQAAKGYELESAKVPEDAPEFTCVLTDRGYLRFRVGRTADAVQDLVRAAELARAQGSEMYRIDANLRLVTVYARYGFYDEARTLADEALAFYLKLGDRVGIMDAYYAEGDLLRNQGKMEESQAIFTKALALARDMGNESDVPVLQERLCRGYALMNRPVEARRVCTETYSSALAGSDPEDAKRALASLGRIELAAGHGTAAVGLLDRALTADGADLPELWRAEMHLLRARARSLIGDTRGALADIKVYNDWLGDDRVAKNVAQVGIIRLKFDRALRQQELGRLRAEATTSRLLASRRTLIMKLALLGTALLLSIVLGAFWIRRRRRDTLRLVQATQERLAAMSQVTGGIAHDFNNQLTVIQQSVWMLLNNPKLADDAENLKLLQGIQQSSRACADITAQMLTFSRQQNLKPEAIHLGQWLRSLLPLLQAVTESAVMVQVEVDEPEPVAWADPRLLAAALLNLVANARDAMTEVGSVLIRAALQSPATVLLTVADTGCGMAPAVLARATEPFYTTKPVGRGSGLGLSTVQGFATQSGGSLHLASKPGHGTMVSLQLPTAGSAHV